MEKLKVLELFGGIGACSKALKRLGIDCEIVDYVEIDKYAVASYNAINGTTFEPQDITQWDKDIEVDLIMHGSPCQDFSLAGLQAGGDEGSGTRSSLMYETIRIVNKLKPKYVIWENVKNLLSDKHRHNFDAYIKQMEDLGYNNYYQVLNSKDYGIPQNRERVFTVSIRNDINKSFVFPPKQELKKRVKDLQEKVVDDKYYLSDRAKLGRLQTTYSQYKLEKNILNNKDVHPTILARYEGAPTLYVENYNDLEPQVVAGIGEKKSNGGRQWYQQDRVYDDNIAISVATSFNPYYVHDLKIRRLIPLEVWRLMGFDDEDFKKASKVNTDTQLYKQAGNSIVVNVLEAIFRELLGDCLKPAPTLNDLLKGL